MRKFMIFIPALGLVLASVFYLTRPSGIQKNKLLITGSSTIAPMMAEAAQDFENKNMDFEVDVQMGGSSKGISDSRKGLADIGMVSRAPKAGEEDLQWIPIAKDGLAIVVHKKNPLTGIDLSTLKKIYTGEIKNWSSLVGNFKLPITVVNKASGRSTLEVFLDYTGLENQEIDADIVIGDNQQGLKTVQGSPGAIAYISIGAAIVDQQATGKIKLLNLNGVEPSIANLKNGKYPITRTLNLTVPKTKANKQSLEKFIDYLKTDSAVRIVRSQNFVPVF